MVHYLYISIAPRRLKKATEAAIQARQWSKAVQIVEMQDPALCKDYCAQIAAHFASTQDYEVDITLESCPLDLFTSALSSPYLLHITPSHTTPSHITPSHITPSHITPPQVAEQYYVKAEKPHDAVEMYIKVGRWEAAYKVASGCMPQAEVKELYVSRAKELEEQGKLREAEGLYAVMGDCDLAISMYKRRKQVRLDKRGERVKLQWGRSAMFEGLWPFCCAV